MVHIMNWNIIKKKQKKCVLEHETTTFIMREQIDEKSYAQVWQFVCLIIYQICVFRVGIRQMNEMRDLRRHRATATLTDSLKLIKEKKKNRSEKRTTINDDRTGRHNYVWLRCSAMRRKKKEWKIIDCMECGFEAQNQRSVKIKTSN